MFVEMFHQKKKAKIEAQMKAEDEEKAKRRRQYLERSEEAAEKRRQIEEIKCKRVKRCGFDDNISAVNVLSEVDRAVAIAAYENIIIFNENIIKVQLIIEDFTDYINL